MLLVWVPVWPNPLESEQHSFSHTITLSLVIAVRQVTHYEIQTVWMLWSQTAQRFELVKSSRTECWVAWFAAPSTFLRLDVNKLETLTPEIWWTFKKKFSRHILLKKKVIYFFSMEPDWFPSAPPWKAVLLFAAVIMLSTPLCVLPFMHCVHCRVVLLAMRWCTLFGPGHVCNAGYDKQLVNVSGSGFLHAGGCNRWWMCDWHIRGQQRT